MATRTAVIGAGAMGKGHLRSLASVPSAEVVALVDPNEETLASVAAENGVASTYTDVASMLAAEQPEYAIVASPVLYHAEQSIAAFEAGAHVLCEKPLSMNTVEAEAIVEAARRAQRLFTMGFQLRQSRAYRALKEFIDEGRLGEVYHARVWAGHIMAYPWGRYHHRKEYSFGGVMAATVVHILDAAMWILGAPEPVTVSANTFRRVDRMPDPPIGFDGTPDDVRQVLARYPDAGSIALVGREPNIRELAGALTGARWPLRFKKGAVCRIDLPGNHHGPPGELRWFLTPRLLRIIGRSATVCDTAPALTVESPDLPR